jgi:hypothetical protein
MVAMSVALAGSVTSTTTVLFEVPINAYSRPDGEA